MSSTVNAVCSMILRGGPPPLDFTTSTSMVPVSSSMWIMGDGFCAGRSLTYTLILLSGSSLDNSNTMFLPLPAAPTRCAKVIHPPKLLQRSTTLSINLPLSNTITTFSFHTTHPPQYSCSDKLRDRRDKRSEVAQLQLKYDGNIEHKRERSIAGVQSRRTPRLFPWREHVEASKEGTMARKPKQGEKCG